MLLTDAADNFNPWHMPVLPCTDRYMYRPVHVPTLGKGAAIVIPRYRYASHVPVDM